jgi:hypothetical protein
LSTSSSSLVVILLCVALSCGVTRVALSCGVTCINERQEAIVPKVWGMTAGSRRRDDRREEGKKRVRREMELECGPLHHMAATSAKPPSKTA